jgi:hypothetical protein
MALDSKYGEVFVVENPVTNPLNATDEPVFILRASDQLSLKVLAAYRELYVDEYLEDGETDDLTASIDGCAEVFEEWQDINAEKVDRPD